MGGVKESRSESEAKTRVFEASSGSDSVKSTSTFPKASSFAGRRSTRVFGRPTQRWEPPAPPTRFAGNSGAREETREGEPASASPLLGPLGPRGLRCSDSSGAACLVHQASCLRLTTRLTAAGPNKVPRGLLLVVWVTSRHGNANRLAFGRARIHGQGRTVRTACSCVVSALQKSVGGILTQRSAGVPFLSRGGAASTWPRV